MSSSWCWLRILKYTTKKLGTYWARTINGGWSWRRAPNEEYTYTVIILQVCKDCLFLIIVVRALQSYHITRYTTWSSVRSWWNKDGGTGLRARLWWTPIRPEAIRFLPYPWKWWARRKTWKTSSRSNGVSWAWSTWPVARDKRKPVLPVTVLEKPRKSIYLCQLWATWYRPWWTEKPNTYRTEIQNSPGYFRWVSESKKVFNSIVYLVNNR